MDKSIQMSEAEHATRLVQRIVDGDRLAEQEMISRYMKGVNAVLYSRSKDAQITQEVSQDTWIVVIQKIREGEIRKPSKLAAFIVQTAKNQLIMNFRKGAKNKTEDAEILDTVAHRGLSPEQETINNQLGETISSLFSEMSQSRDVEILQRFYLQGHTKAVLCDEYSMKAAHFDRVLFRARQRFKSLWSAKEEAQA